MSDVFATSTPIETKNTRRLNALSRGINKTIQEIRTFSRPVEAKPQMSVVIASKPLLPELEGLIVPDDLGDIRALNISPYLQNEIVDAIEEIRKIYRNNVTFKLTYSHHSEMLWVECWTDLEDVDVIVDNDTKFHDEWLFKRKLVGVSFSRVGFRSIPCHGIQLD